LFIDVVDLSLLIGEVCWVIEWVLESEVGLILSWWRLHGRGAGGHGGLLMGEV
jgi:hypothetical protein